MAKFNSDKRSAGPRSPKGRGFNPKERSFSRNSGFGKPDFSRSDMFPAICASCGADCEVPFRPAPTKQVFCNACFNREGTSSGRVSFERRPTSGSSRDFKPTSAGPDASKRQLDHIEAKLDRILAILSDDI